jgi:hypothetical protein
MPFSAGELCCPSEACVMLDLTPSESSASWDKIPHVTRIAFTKTSAVKKLVTSSTGGNEKTACGTVTSAGNLAIACHNGASQPAPFKINGIYHIMWSVDCDNILESPIDPYYEANIRIVSVPVDFDIAGNSPVVYNYGFEVDEWLYEPATQAEEEQ